VISVTIISEIKMEGENLYTSPLLLHILPFARGSRRGYEEGGPKREVFDL
jgi:hypothetical protein